MVKTSLHVNETGEFIVIYESSVPIMTGLKITVPQHGLFKVVRATRRDIVTEIPEYAVAIVIRLG